jgi:hypothetical protein
MDKKLYLVTMVVEGYEQVEEDKDGDEEEDDDQNGDDNELEDDDCGDLDDFPKSMETDKKRGKWSKFTTSAIGFKQYGGSKTLTMGSDVVDQQAPEMISALYRNTMVMTELINNDLDAGLKADASEAENKESMWEGRSESREIA